MSSLRKLERSVIMHKSYELCGSKKNVATPATAVTTSN